MTARVFLPAILSAGLLWTAFFPLDLGPVACVALVPFLTLVRAEGVGPWRRYAAAYLGGLVFFGLALKWVRVAHPMMALFAWPGGALYCGAFWPVALFLLRRLDRLKLPFVVTLPPVWVGLEYVRTHFPTGFPFLSEWFAYQSFGFGWYALGYAFHRIIPLIQAADLGGVYLLSVAAAALNGAAYEWVMRSNRVRAVLRWPARTERDAPLRPLWLTAGAVALPAVFVAYGTVRLDHPAFPKGPRLALLQGNLPQDLKNLRGDQKGQTALAPVDEEYWPLARQAARPANNHPAPDLIVWPETCFGENWMAAKPGVPGDPAIAEFAPRLSQWQDLLGRTVAGQVRTSALVGLNTQEWDGARWRKYNSAVLFDPSGAYHGRYDKIHLVPFGEYVPLREQLPWLQRLTPYTHDYSCTPGDAWTRFALPTPDRGAFIFGVLICYEDTDPAFARRYNPAAGTGPGVDFLINTSNDGWFDGTEEHEQHLAICRFRAVEARRSVARAVNMGVSAVIDPDGRVVALPTADPSWAKGVKTPGIVRAEVPIDRRESVYARFGDWVPALCWVFVAVGLVLRRWQRKGE